MMIHMPLPLPLNYPAMRLILNLNLVPLLQKDEKCAPLQAIKRGRACQAENKNISALLNLVFPSPYMQSLNDLTPDRRTRMTVENSKPEEQVDVAEQETVEQVEEILSEEETATSELEQRIEELTDQLAQAKDQTLRAHAESQNIKRRAEQDVEKAHKFALEKFVGELIPVLESLEKGMESAEQSEGSSEAMLEGMRLIQKQFLDALAKFKVEQVDPAGQPFDPNFHQAISMVPNPELEPNTVMDVFQKGYTLHGRVVRPAMVVVSN